MTGEAHWLTLLLLGTSAIALVALFYSAARLNRRFRLTRQKLECPVFREDVKATMIRDEKWGELTSVQTCSHFVKPGAVTCEQGCLRTLNSEVTRRRKGAQAPRPLVTSTRAAR